MKLVSDFFRSKSAATSIEYALIAAGISIVILAAINGMGTTMNGKYTTIRAAFD